LTAEWSAVGQRGGPAGMPRLAVLHGILHALRMYYGNPLHVIRLQRFYAQFVRRGDLCFDVGANVGSRTAIWSRLGARVVAVEPQPLMMQLLRLWFGRSHNVLLLQQALGAQPGRQVMLVNDRAPTISTLSREWIDTVSQVSRFAAERWDREVTVEVTTLDALIARYGEPAFCKIDVEGYDLEVLRGLSRPLPTLSVEHVPASREIGLGCLERLRELGPYEFNWSSGESMRWHFPVWVEAEKVAEVLREIPADGMPGDIYARLRR
jgi:FkbM family methyltransferase